MKKRSIFTIALAIALTAVISVGATLAYLTADDTKVVNTFQFANNMTVELTEDIPTGKIANETYTAQAEGKGIVYGNVVPDQELYKKPEIKATTSVPAYVFVKVSGASENVHPTGITAGWKAVVDGTADTYWNGIYVMPIDTSMTEKVSIFEKVKVGNPELKDDQTVDLGSITIEVFEIQQSGFVDKDGKTAVQNALDQAVWASSETPATPAG